MVGSLALLLLASSVAMFMWAVFGFAMSRSVGRLDLADVLWGPGFVLLVVTGWQLEDGTGARCTLMGVLVTLWAVRLALHTGLRLGQTEDRRYVQMKASWGQHKTAMAFWKVFMVQAGLTLLVGMPIIVVNSTSNTALNSLDWFGVAIWLLGFGWELVADWQLRRHLAEPSRRGTLLTTGLWRYSRHPNYFGEVTQWWGLFMMCLSVPLGFAGVVGPLTITFLILKVSGVPLLERHYEGRADWEAYKSSTSMLVPLRPRPVLKETKR